MKEIETKFKLHNGTSFEDVIDVFKERYSFNDSIKVQHDVIYLHPDQVDKPIVEGSQIIRIRTTNHNNSKETVLTLKVQTDRPLISDEYELKIDDSNIAKSFIEGLGFIEVVAVSKRRVESKVDNYTICIDEVDKLGVFIELEVLIDDADITGDIGLTQNEMSDFLGKLGLKGEVNMIPYDTQVREYDRAHFTR